MGRRYWFFCDAASEELVAESNVDETGSCDLHILCHIVEHA